MTRNNRHILVLLEDDYKDVLPTYIRMEHAIFDKYVSGPHTSFKSKLRMGTTRRVNITCRTYYNPKTCYACLGQTLRPHIRLRVLDVFSDADIRMMAEIMRPAIPDTQHDTWWHPGPES